MMLNYLRPNKVKCHISSSNMNLPGILFWLSGLKKLSITDFKFAWFSWVQINLLQLSPRDPRGQMWPKDNEMETWYYCLIFVSNCILRASLMAGCLVGRRPHSVKACLLFSIADWSDHVMPDMQVIHCNVLRPVFINEGTQCCKYHGWCVYVIRFHFH